LLSILSVEFALLRNFRRRPLRTIPCQRLMRVEAECRVRRR
jgi:hypothetical protein